MSSLGIREKMCDEILKAIKSIITEIFFRMPTNALSLIVTRGHSPSRKTFLTRKMKDVGK